MANEIYRPFLVQFPDFPIKKGVTNAEVEKHMAALEGKLNFKPRPTRQSTVQTSSTMKSPQPESQETPGTVLEEGISLSNLKTHDIGFSESTPFGLSENELAMLMEIKNHPFRTVREFYKALGMTTHLGNKTKKQIQAGELISEIDIWEGKRGNRRKLLKLTPMAEGKIGRQNLGKGKGGLLHVYWQHFFHSEAIRHGYKATIEEFHNGKAVDVGLHSIGDARRIAIEIETSVEGAISNIRKNLAAEFWHEVWTISANPNVHALILKHWQSQNGKIVSRFPDAVVRFFTVKDDVFGSS